MVVITGEKQKRERRKGRIYADAAKIKMNKWLTRIVIIWAIVMGIVIAMPMVALFDKMLGGFEDPALAEEIAKAGEEMFNLFLSPACQIPLILGQVGLLILIFITERD